MDLSDCSLQIVKYVCYTLFFLFQYLIKYLVDREKTHVNRKNISSIFNTEYIPFYQYKIKCF